MPTRKTQDKPEQIESDADSSDVENPSAEAEGGGYPDWLWEQLQTLQADERRLFENQEAAQAAIHEIDKKQAAIIERLDGLDARTRGIDAATAESVERLDLLGEQFSTINSGNHTTEEVVEEWVGVEADGSNGDTADAALAQIIGAQFDTLGAVIVQRVDGLSSQIDGLYRRSYDLEDRLRDVKAQGDAVGSDVGSLEAQYDRLEEHIAGIHAHCHALDEHYQGLLSEFRTFNSILGIVGPQPSAGASGAMAAGPAAGDVAQPSSPSTNSPRPVMGSAVAAIPNRAYSPKQRIQVGTINSLGELLRVSTSFRDALKNIDSYPGGLATWCTDFLTLLTAANSLLSKPDSGINPETDGSTITAIDATWRDTAAEFDNIVGQAAANAPSDPNLATYAMTTIAMQRLFTSAYDQFDGIMSKSDLGIIGAEA